MLLPCQNYSVGLYGFQEEVQIGLHSKFLPMSLSSISTTLNLLAKLCNRDTVCILTPPHLCICCKPNQGIPQQSLNANSELKYNFIQEISPKLIG